MPNVPASVVPVYKSVKALRSTVFNTFSILLEYPDTASETYKDSITYCAVVDLYVRCRLNCTQSSSDTIQLESSRDRMLALLALSSAKEYNVYELD